MVSRKEPENEGVLFFPGYMQFVVNTEQHLNMYLTHLKQNVAYSENQAHLDDLRRTADRGVPWPCKHSIENVQSEFQTFTV